MVSGECRGIPTSPLTMCAKRPPGTGIRRAGGWWKGKFQFVRRPWICRATQVRQVVRTIERGSDRLAFVPKAPCQCWTGTQTRLISLVTSRIAREAGPALVRAPREAGDKSRAAPATVTGEPRSTHATGSHPGRRGAAAIRKPGDLPATVVRRRAGCTGSQRSVRGTAPSRHERRVRSWREEWHSST